MKKFYFSVLSICSFGLTLPALAQQEFKSSLMPDVVVAKKASDEGGRAQNVFVEVGGQGLLFTANYDSRFSKGRNGLGGRVGIGYISGGDANATTVPVSLNYLLGNGGKHFFEVGLGATAVTGKSNGSFFFEDDNSPQRNSNVIGTMSFSYRLQPVNSGFSFRGGLTPIFGGDFFFPYFGGVSLGYTF